MEKRYTVINMNEAHLFPRTREQAVAEAKAAAGAKRDSIFGVYELVEVTIIPPFPEVKTEKVN